jgi:uncharacterized FlaG/YvyC family protein
MNIKSVTGPNIPLDIKKVERKTRDASADSEPQQHGDDSKKEHRKLTQEELDFALEFLKNLKGIKDNNLRIRLDAKDDIVVVYIEDIHGKVIRRIPESDLLSLTKDKDKPKGNIFDKAM